MPENSYKDMFAYVRKQLQSVNPNAGSSIKNFNYNRYFHIERVYAWMKRLVAELPGEITVKERELHVATIFHDAGYGILEDRKLHARSSAELCRRYLTEQGYEENFIRDVEYLVANHSRKELLREEDTPIELILLMEADLMDDMGSLGITMDIMIEAGKPGVTYPDILEHMKKYSLREIRENPMVTGAAQGYWKEKQQLTEEFVRQFTRDISAGEGYEHDVL